MDAIQVPYSGWNTAVVLCTDWDSFGESCALPLLFMTTTNLLSTAGWENIRSQESMTSICILIAGKEGCSEKMSCKREEGKYAYGFVAV